ncbi:hypothetical protein BDF20DRAFT_630803 [Mycotypha africana]|uniref:uncharacterized protein n=1 Tax=Mycotypha africana TaxID=64632 RepID=UPI002301C7CB|nr:uncharacterized protein BDF20DRAFT_630803 [Mycotypha africana]KAI8973176.1 hypothetical protein BDF20DRAFT_630803 [Mycotypha africana]
MNSKGKQKEEVASVPNSSVNKQQLMEKEKSKGSTSKKYKMEETEINNTNNDDDEDNQKNDREHNNEEEFNDDDVEDEDDDELDSEEERARVRRVLGMQMQGIFGSNGSGGFLSSDFGRFKHILNELRNSNDDPTVQLVALQELAEILSISSEDSLPGYFSIDAFAKELVRIMKGPVVDDITLMQQEGDMDQDMLLALAMSEGLVGGNPEVMLLACRCISNLIEAMPTSVTSIASHGAVHVLCQKLKSIQYIDLAEQALFALEKISVQLPRAVVHEGGLTATLMYFDFFNIHAQRTALRTASNCMRGLDLESFSQVIEVVPILMNTIAHSDRSIIELTCLCWVRIAEGYRSHRASFERAISNDLLKILCKLLPVPGNTNAVHPGTFQDLLRIFRAISKASPQLSFELLQLGIIDSFYQILIGSATLPDLKYVSLAATSQQHITLDSKWRDSVPLIMKIIVDLLPPLPKDDLFSSKRFKQQQPTPFSSSTSSHMTTRSMSLATTANDNEQKDTATTISDDPRVKWLQEDQHAMLKMDIVLIPLILDMYSSTVNLRVRQLVTHTLVKLLHYSEGNTLQTVLTGVGLSSFLSGVLVRQEHPVLVVDALYQAEILIRKLPDIYRTSFEREGVIHEIVAISKLPLVVNDGKQQRKEEEIAHPELASSSQSRNSNNSTVKKTNYEDDFFQSMRLDYDESDEATATTDVQGGTEGIETVTDDEKDQEFRECQKTATSTSVSSTTRKQEKQRKKLNSFLIRTQQLLQQQQRSSSFHAKSSSRHSHHHQYHISDNEKGVGRGSTRKYIILLAQYFVEHYIKTEQVSGDVVSTSNSFVEISQFTKDLLRKSTAAQAEESLRSLSRYLQASNMGISSFELINTGLLQALLSYLTTTKDNEQSLLLEERTQLFKTVFIENPDIDHNTQSSSLKKLVIRLQEILSRSESFDVVTPLDTTSSDNLRNPTSMLAKQLRLRLTGVGAHIPGIYKQLMVSTHAVATFKILEEYLLARIQTSSLLRADDGSSSEREENSQEHSEMENYDESDDDMDVDPELEGDTLMRETIIVDKKGSTEDTTLKKSESDNNVSTSHGSSRRKNQHQKKENNIQEKSVKKEGEWKIRFTVDNMPISNESTVYAAVHHSAMEKKAKNQEQHGNLDTAAATSDIRNIWTVSHPITYERYWELSSHSEKSNHHTNQSKSVRHDYLHSAKIPQPKELQQKGEDSNICFQVLYLLKAISSVVEEKQTDAIIAEDFINRKLTAKANRQLEEPLIVASSCLPSWIYWLMHQTPFLFPFETRYLFIQSTSFGYARLIARWQSLQMRNQNSQNHHHNRSINDEQQLVLGRMERQKVRIARSHILESAIKVMDMFGSSPSILEFEYMGEEGTGLGPTLEFYACCSKEFTKRSLNMWRGSSASVAGNSGNYVDAPFGLFPKTISKNIGKSSRKIISLFKTLGQFVAKGLLDFRIIDIPFSPAFFKVVLHNVEPSEELLMDIDPQLAKSIRSLRAYADRKREIYDDVIKTSIEEKLSSIKNIEINGAKIDDMCLDFTLVGDATFELKPGGADIPVTIYNVEEYIELLLDAIAGSGISEQVKAFIEGFNGLFPIEDLKLLTSAELVSLFGGNGQDNVDWSFSTLSDTIRADHGFTKESEPVRYLLEILSEFNNIERRQFLQFTTGSPRLPIGGWRALRPTFTVVRKIPEAPLTPDDYLPSVMTCANYLKMPAYTTKEIMFQKLIIAMKEGQSSFLLS